MKNLLRSTVFAISALGLFLTSVNIFGLTQSLRLPELVAFDNGMLDEVDSDGLQVVPLAIIGKEKASGLRLTRQQSLARFEEIRAMTSQSEQVFAIQSLVTDSTVHFWPTEGWGQDFRREAFQVPLWENWVLWSAGNILSVLSPQLGDRFFPYEFLNGRKSWERGAGLCGEISSMVIYLLDEVGIKSGKAGLDGHVVALAQTDYGQNYIIDADFGFTLPGTLNQISQNTDVIASKVNENLADIYGPDGNIEFWDGDRGYRPTGYLFERGSYAAKWLFPMLLISLIFLIRLPVIREKDEPS